ncbi:uncharacterized protein LOC130447422 [Diorhabda sublineata]|uniref:uncharacterized protein LOC130447422 n=1 Tax=Diorhabda sublineata TaxID=1163346 RepID=UPI0024E12F8C|nr:uncharacterized protein LOC130447422 [Diorhabda sublineata]XP_056640215.1 uncharacterized protein LOC130447422 [Diorhabda sublineata]
MEKVSSNMAEQQDENAPITSSPKQNENIRITTKDSAESNELVEKVISGEKMETVFDKKPPIETVANEKVNENNPATPSNDDTIEDAPAPLPNTRKLITEKRRVGSASSALVTEKINRNQSDIFSLKDETTIASSIFSVNGSPSRKVYRNVQKIPSNNVFSYGQLAEPLSDQITIRDKMRNKESYHDIKRPTSSLRNPLTGTGLSSNDEYKFKGNRKLDGNPLLGLGYTPEVAPSTHRIPPGGYSHKLW